MWYPQHGDTFHIANETIQLSKETCNGRVTSHVYNINPQLIHDLTHAIGNVNKGMK